MNRKILSLDELIALSEKYRGQGESVALCHGTFDLLHIGHIRHLAAARRQCDRLLITITADAYVNKGPGRPVFNEQLRAEQLAAIEYIDGIAINYDTTSVNVIHAVKPTLYIKGKDYENNREDVTGNIQKEKRAVESCGGDIAYTDEITFSSSKLLNEHFDVFSPETKDYLDKFKQQHSCKEVIAVIETLKDLRVLVVGDTIIDEYYYTSTLGKSGKYNVLAARFNSSERFAGGAVAVANHVAGFVNSVTLFTGFGAQKTEEAFVRSKLKSNVEIFFMEYPEATTLIKRRYVDDNMIKLFEVYYGGEYLPDRVLNEYACQWLHHHLAEFDVVVVPDYGNGFITDSMIQALCQQSRFLAVNTQINSGNRGFHVITRYPHVNFVSLNEPELRLAAHSQRMELTGLMDTICQLLQASHIAITRGTEGVLMQDRGLPIHQTPALSTRVVDRVGAGDAFLAMASILLGGGVKSDVVAFVASAAAAIDVQIVCNRDTIEPVNLYKYITTLLK